MSLNMYLGEIDVQTSTITDICSDTIYAMEQVIHSIDTFTGDVILKGVTYDSAKIYFSQTYRLLAQGIIIYCEELIRQNQAFPTDFRSEVADTDVMEEEVKEQIREAKIMILNLEEAVSNNLAVNPQTTLFDSVKSNLERKLEDLYYFNSQSSIYFEEAEKLATDIESGLTNIQGGKGFSQISSTFSLTGITINWQTALRKANDAIKIKELKNYDVYAVVYLNAKGEAQIRWHLEKDGKGVTNPELYSYLFQSGKYLDGEDYTIWSMDDYNARLKDGWRKGINYQNGDEYNSFISGTLAASQYVEDGYDWTQETGMYDIILMAGLSYASYKSTTPKATNGNKSNSKLTQESVNAKLEGYLLDKNHPIGGSKANWFEKALGFNKTNSSQLSQQIIFDEAKAVQTAVTEYGTKYSQITSIKGANGKVINVEFVWIKNKDGVIRLVTSIPTKK